MFRRKPRWFRNIVKAFFLMGIAYRISRSFMKRAEKQAGIVDKKKKNSKRKA